MMIDIFSDFPWDYIYAWTRTSFTTNSHVEYAKDFGASDAGTAASGNFNV